MNQVFADELFLPLPRDKVFAFFATPRNLEAITPPWLNFRMNRESLAQPGPGAEYTYRLRIRGIPVKWKTRITEWEPGRRFVDVQLRGPYARWHHTHTFEDADDGTRIRDCVSYRLPLGPVGQFLAGRLVAADIRKIFHYRKGKTVELLLAPEKRSEDR